MKKILFCCCAVLCLLVGITACGPKNPNELILKDAVISYGMFGDRGTWIDFTYRTTSKKEYDLDIFLINENGEKLSGKKIPGIGWDIAPVVNGIREVSIRVNLIDGKDADKGRIRITIKDGDKVIKEQIFNYECKEREKE